MLPSPGKDSFVIRVIRDNARVFFYILLGLILIIITLLAILLGWAHTILNNTNIPAVCNVTCPVPVCNCPPPIFNGTVDFNGTLICNATSNNLIINDTACGTQATFQQFVSKPCSILMYDTITQKCVGSDGSITQQDGTECSNECFDNQFTIPVCSSGRCVGECKGRCDVDDIGTCRDFDNFYNDQPFILNSNVTMNKACLPYGSGTVFIGSAGTDPFLFGNPINQINTFIGSAPAGSRGNCLWQVTVTRYIDSVPYANINETIVPADSFCNSFLDHSSVIPNVFTTPDTCLEVVGAQGVVLTNSDTSPYTTKSIYTCSFQYICSRRDPSDEQQFLIM